MIAMTILTSQVKLGSPQTLPGIRLAISAGRLQIRRAHCKITQVNWLCNNGAKYRTVEASTKYQCVPHSIRGCLRGEEFKAYRKAN